MKARVCPQCGAILKEDAWETLNETADGGFIIDVYPAFICSNKQCEFVERIGEYP
ncbi:hypothetical protein ACLM5H_17070 [Fredinandcohnia humi]